MSVGKFAARPIDPRDKFVAVQTLINNQRHNGRFADHDERVAAQHADAVRQMVEQIEADQRLPITERVPEYVLRYDDDGNVVGVKPAN